LSYEGEQIGQGRDAAARALKENPEMQEKLIAKIKEAHDGVLAGK
jgi:hypothetical protein